MATRRIQPPPERGRKKRRVMRRANRAVLRWLIFCFPAGLLMMWSNRCTWPRVMKSAISLGMAAALLALVLPQTRPPERADGGVQIVSLQAAVDLQGPEPEFDEDFEVYVPEYVPSAELIVEPTPTPEPIYVYCNDGGRYYHVKRCHYVKQTTPKVTLSQALNAGFKQCRECDAPSESLG